MDERTIISQRYLHVTNIPVWQNENGSLEVPSLWYKDLREHVAYLPEFQLAAPLAATASKETSVRMRWYRRHPTPEHPAH